MCVCVCVCVCVRVRVCACSSARPSRRRGWWAGARSHQSACSMTRPTAANQTWRRRRMMTSWRRPGEPRSPAFTWVTHTCTHTHAHTHTHTHMHISINTHLTHTHTHARTHKHTHTHTRTRTHTPSLCLSAVRWNSALRSFLPVWITFPRTVRGGVCVSNLNNTRVKPTDRERASSLFKQRFIGPLKQVPPV